MDCFKTVPARRGVLYNYKCSLHLLFHYIVVDFLFNYFTRKSKNNLSSSSLVSTLYKNTENSFIVRSCVNLSCARLAL